MELTEWFMPVDTIYKLEENSYLVLTKGVGRPRAIESSLDEVAYCLGTDKQLLHKIVAKGSLSSFISEKHWSEPFLPPFFDEYNNLITYNNSTQILNVIDYQYDDEEFFESNIAKKETKYYTFESNNFELTKTISVEEIGK